MGSHWPECGWFEHQKGETAVDSSTLTVFSSVNSYNGSEMLLECAPCTTPCYLDAASPGASRLTADRALAYGSAASKDLQHPDS